MSNHEHELRARDRQCIHLWHESSGKDGDSNTFVEDKSGDSHHGGTSVVDLDRSLLELGFGIELVPSKVEGAVPVVTDVFGLVVEPVGIAVDNGGHGHKGEHLQQDVLSVLGGKEVVEGLESGGDVSGSGESDSGGGGQVSDHGEHGNTSVGEFVLSEKVELFLRAVGTESDRIVESELYCIVVYSYSWEEE